MQDLNDKVTGGSLTATEWNEVPSELQNVIEALGQTLSSGDLNQLGKAIASYVAEGQVYTDSGAANAYALGAISGKQGAVRYAVGTTVVFSPANTNTGASTVNVNGLGVKAIERFGSAIRAGDIEAGSFVRLRYDGAAFQVVPFEGLRDMVLLKSGRKNAIINGNFDIWQRATSQTSSGYGSDDRWSNDNTGTTKTHSQQAFTLGQTDVPGNPEFYSRTVVSSVAGASNFCRKRQAIEGVNTLSGETVTFAFWAKADAAKDIALECVQNFGTGGSPSAEVTGIGVTTLSLSTAWQRFEVTVAIPSISSKTLGTNGDDYLAVVLWFDAGSSFDARTNTLGQQSGTFDIARVQLELGDVATDFERRTIGEELALCQRYYQEFAWGGLAPYAGRGGSGLLAICGHISFPTEMRAVPTGTIIGGGTGGILVNMTNNVTDASGQTITCSAFAPSSFRFLVAGAANGVHYSVSASAAVTAAFDAEL